MRRMKSVMKERIAALTHREYEVLRGIALGQDDAVLARRLAVKLPTIAKHRLNIVKKLHQDGAAQPGESSPKLMPTVLKPLST